MGGGNTDLQSSPNHNDGGVNINRQLRQAEVSMGPDYYSPSPWVRYREGQMNLKLKLMGK